MFPFLSRALMGTLVISLFTGGLWASSCHVDHGKKKDHKHEQHKFMAKGTQKVCPIRKEAIDPEVSVDYQGQRIYFCCPGCDKKFLENPDAYFAEMKERGEIAENIQQICPVSDEKLEDHDTFVTLPGRKVYLCCKNCKKKFKKGKEKYLAKMSGKKAAQKKDGHQGHDHSGHQH